ncbi:MAG TPA: 2Fe-2S iron-sulfur cluster binding domain-containing protein [Micavibrio sp.]|nr:2Fe-2S iron-sulfur cluster binding domain-containing protein [Micavibrio sp.]
MPTITFIYPDGSRKDVDAPIGLSLMEIAQKHDIEEIEGACGGAMACATCHMYIHPEWEEKCLQGEDARSEEEEDMLDLAFDVRDNSRLGCQIMMTEDLDGLVVALPGAEVAEWEKAA